MRVALLANETAGRGRAIQAARLAAEQLSGAGHDARVVLVGPGTDAGAAAEHVAAAQVVVASGGDGTVLHAARAILALSGPRPAIYHLPCGNENLFAREFGMTRGAGVLVRALAATVVRPVDVGWISADGTAPSPFLIMASIGPDASVIQRLAMAPRKLSGHAAYFWPIVAELRSPWFPRMCVRVDDRPLASAGQDQGVLVVGNCRQYALRMDPAVGARMDDGQLDAVFLPCRTRIRALRWAVECRFRRHLSHESARHAGGARIDIDSTDGRPLPIQVDGEAFAPGREIRSVALTVTPAALPVLVPP